MGPGRIISLGALLCAVGFAAGAFGAHALEARLEASDHLDTWQTAVRYQVWSSLGLIAFGLFRERARGGALVAYCLTAGTLLFSGSLYLLSLELGGKIAGPVTPLGGALLITGWVAFAVEAWKSGLRAGP